MMKFKEIIKNKPVYSQILLDENNWDSILGPQFILGKNFKLIPIMIGTPIIEDIDRTEKMVGIFVNSKFYNDIDHTKSYIFIHEIMEYINITEIKKMIKENQLLKDVDDHLSSSRDHVHIAIHLLKNTDFIH